MTATRTHTATQEVRYLEAVESGFFPTECDRCGHPFWERQRVVIETADFERPDGSLGIEVTAAYHRGCRT